MDLTGYENSCSYSHVLLNIEIILHANLHVVLARTCETQVHQHHWICILNLNRTESWSVSFVYVLKLLLRLLKEETCARRNRLLNIWNLFSNSICKCIIVFWISVCWKLVNFILLILHGHGVQYYYTIQESRITAVIIIVMFLLHSHRNQLLSIGHPFLFRPIPRTTVLNRQHERFWIKDLVRVNIILTAMCIIQLLQLNRKYPILEPEPRPKHVFS